MSNVKVIIRINKMFDEVPQSYMMKKSLLKAYSMKKSSYLSNIGDSEFLNPNYLQKPRRSLKTKIGKKRKNSKILSSRGEKKSCNDSFKLSLFKPDQIGEMLNSLSNLESNASNYSSTTLSPSPKRPKSNQ
mmetsp:Transcript_3154/g.2623  ORF Transcript_3154/g.2623 Transcript_3154/m.2623 type:complete len:131 (+) Transcript_3154:392-784(+)